MGYTLNNLCEDSRLSLISKPGYEGREEVRRHLEKLLSDKEFVAKYCGPDAEVGKEVLYTDPELGFTVINFISPAGRVESPPHDHGDSWAIYGQATLHTAMRDWVLETSEVGTKASEAKPVREYRLEPGQAHLYDVGDIHSIHPSDNCRYVRIAGTPEDAFNPVGPTPD